jgi:MFS family permease
MGIARRLALGRLISLTGGSAAYIALTAAIYDETGSAAWLSAALFAGVIGTVVAAPFSGWLGDNYDRRLVLIAADLAAAAVSLAMALSGQPEALVVLLGLSAVAQSPFEPASAAAIPNLVAPAEVPRANSLVASTGSAGYLIGPLLGGIVLGAGASPSTLFVIDAATFVVSALIIASIRRPFGSGGTAEYPGLLAGFRLIAGRPSLRLLVAAGMASLVGIGIVNVAAYPLSLELDGGTEG